MAGNTKFMGFGVSEEGSSTGLVHLERWGGKTSVPVSADSLNSLRKACYQDLPKAPPKEGKGVWTDFNAAFDDTGLSDGIDVKLSATGAALLREVLDAATIYAGSSSLSETELSFVKDSLSILDKAISERDRCFNSLDEPGVDQK